MTSRTSYAPGDAGVTLKAALREEATEGPLRVTIQSKMSPA